MNLSKKSGLSVLMGFVAFSLFATHVVNAEINPFTAQEAITQTVHAEAGKCGEGKCGESKAKKGKCGEGKCGENKAKKGKCGEGKSKKCGE
ncbi:MAG: hypothetical protein QF552_02270 [Litorilituus sp.]|nr:hypothetical protein [Litorilituus sp.]